MEESIMRTAKVLAIGAILTGLAIGSVSAADVGGPDQNPNQIRPNHIMLNSNPSDWQKHRDERRHLEERQRLERQRMHERQRIEQERRMEKERIERQNNIEKHQQEREKRRLDEHRQYPAHYLDNE